METRKAKWLTHGLFVGLGFSVAALVVPVSAHAGGIRISIGIPAPVYVEPPPVVVYPAPVVVQPAPGIVYPPPVAFSAPYGVYRHHVPPGFAKQHYGYHPAYGYKFYKHKKHHRKHHHDDD
jgi:hypothetical protein